MENKELFPQKTSLEKIHFLSTHLLAIKREALPHFSIHQNLLVFQKVRERHSLTFSAYMQENNVKCSMCSHLLPFVEFVSLIVSITE